MNDFLRTILFFITLLGICSCVQKPAKPVAMEDKKAFVHIADVRALPLDGEPRFDVWGHVHNILDTAGIQNFLEPSSGTASIYVEPKRTNEAILLLCKDALVKGYWISVPSIRIDDVTLRFNDSKSNMQPSAAIELVSHLRAGMREKDATVYLEQHGLKAGIEAGDSFGWSRDFSLADGCSLRLDFKPKVFRPDGEWADGLLEKAYIHSNLVDIISILLTNAPLCEN